MVGYYSFRRKWQPDNMGRRQKILDFGVKWQELFLFVCSETIIHKPSSEQVSLELLSARDEIPVKTVTACLWVIWVNSSFKSWWLMVCLCVCSTISAHARVLHKSEFRIKLSSTGSSPSISLTLPVFHAPLIHSVACSYSSENRAEKMRESTPKWRRMMCKNNHCARRHDKPLNRGFIYGSS